MGTSSGAYELNHECASMSDLITRTKRVPIFYYHDKPRVQMFYFDSNTIVPFQSAALVFFGKRMLTGCCLVDCSLGSK